MKYVRYPCSGCYLIGPTGPKGDTVVSFKVGNTTTALPGEQALVINRGTPTNVVLDFVIPAGKTGAVPTLLIGNVTTGPPGTSAAVTIIPIQENERR